MTEINHFPFSITEDDHFSIIEKYFVENGPVRHQFESYEYMVHHTIQKIFDECTSIEITTKTSNYKATFGQVYFEKASIIDENRQIKHITPHEARIRDITYDSPIFVDIKEEFWEKKEDGQEEKVNIVNHAKVFLLRLPTMVRSSRCNLYGKSADECIKLGECENDPGGYFLVNGKERALIYQERLNYNQTYCFESNSDKYPFVVEIRSMSEETCHSILLKATLDKDCRNCCFSLPYMSKEVCAGSVFKALGFNNEEIIQFINPSSPEENKLVERLIRESIMYTTKEKALKYISKSSIQKVEDSEERRIHYTIQVLENELFPHMGISTNLEKGLLLGTMINKLFRVSLGKRKHDDRDNVSIKRIEGPGVLLGDLFRMCLKRYCDNLKKYLEKRQDIITAISRTNSITAAIRNPMATGNWCAQKNTYVRTGVSQIMSRLSYPATISHLRRIVIPIGKEGKNVKIRQIHPTQCFFIDTIESPEGKGIGIIKNFALMSKVTVGCNSILVRKMVEQSTFIYSTSQFFEMKDNRQCSMIYLNGTLIGITDKIDECYDELYKMKYEQNLFSNQVSFFKDKDDHELRIFCDHGRFTRPLLKVNKDKDNNLELGVTKQHLSHTWNELIENDIIQYVDSNEVEQSLIAMYPSDLLEYSNQPYNYCEIHPSTMLGVCSSVIPYGEHNQNPRLVYEASMMKQALGMYALSHKGRFDTISHVMHYPQKPLVETKYNSILHYDEMLTGINPIVAIACYTGFNQEDSVILNKASVDRGMFVTTAYRTITFEEKKKTNCSFEKIEIPPLKSQKKELNYSKLGPNGIVKKGLPVYKGDVVVGKTLTKVQKDEQEEKMDCSLSISIGEEGIIDEIWTGPCEEGFFMVKIKIRQMRIPEVGDKLASRSSQKGVCGLLLEQENMPFTSEGITPDLLMNPHCFTKDTLVTLCSGLSVAISELSIHGGEKVWSHNKSGVTTSTSMSMGCGGTKALLKLTFEDGRTIRCTPGHKFYTTDGRWIEAEKIDMKHDKVQMSLDGVVDHIGNDEKDWKMDITCDVDKRLHITDKTYLHTFSMNTTQEREKTLAFSRIIGQLLSDGCINKSKDKSLVYFGCVLDATVFQQDVFLLSGKIPKIQENISSIGFGKVFIIHLPHSITQWVSKLDGITIGKRTQQKTYWPSFLFTSPKSVVREFLAGLFGGDGHAPYLSKEHVQEIRFSQTSKTSFEDHFTEKMQQLCELLNKFGVDAIIERKRWYHVSDPQKYIHLPTDYNHEEYMTTIYIIIRNGLAFAENIGMRYCIEKMNRLTIFKSYKKLQERVKDQYTTIFDMVERYIASGKTIDNSIELARIEFLEKHIALSTYYTLGISGKTQVKNRLKKNRNKDIVHFNYKHFPTFNQYITQLGCKDWFSSKTYMCSQEQFEMPTFSMKVVGRQLDGEEPIYCINVKDYNTFLACGAIVANSQPSRMTLSQLIECLYSKVGSLDGTFGDSTAFTKQSINPVEGIANMLKRHGFQKYGNERLYNGFTGELLDSELFIGPTYYQRLKHLVADKIHCLTTDHEVLTLHDGWKPIANITLADEIATLSPNDELYYQRPTHVYNYPDYNGFLYSVESSLVSLTVTEKHRMWVKQTGDHFFEFKTPEQMLGKHYIYKKDAKWHNKPIELPLEFDSNMDISQILLTRGRFPDWVMFLSIEQTRELIDSTFLDQECYYTTQIIADQIQQLCLHAGWTCLIKSQKNIVSFEIKKTNMNYYEPYHEKFYKQENVKGCRVICLTVPNEIFYVRRNGKAVWTGNSRATGNVTMMHHQPSEGRSREGGLRVGEMERDALISHGGAAFIQETLFDMSDQYQVNVCEQCGNILSSMTACRICKIGQVNRTNIPYCAKLLFQELEAMGIKIQIHTK